MNEPYSPRSHDTALKVGSGGRLSGVLTILIFFLSVMSGCGEDLSRQNPITIWGIEKTEFVSRLRHGDREFLRHLDLGKLPLDEVRRAGDGAAWYVAHVFAELGMDEIEERLLELEWKKGKGSFRREAGKLLLARYFTQERYQEAEALARSFVKRFPDAKDVARRLIEARYRQQMDDSVIRDLEKFDADPDADQSDLYQVEEPEMLLWDAVAKSRLGKPGWDDLFRSLFFEYPASAIHGRAWEFIGISEERSGYFSPAELDIFSGKVKTFLQEYGNAGALFEPYIDPASPVKLSAWLIREAGRAFLGSDKASEGAERIEALLPVLMTDEARFAALEMSGRLYRAAGLYDRAIEMLASSLALAPDAGHADRALWYLLSSRVRKAPESGAAYIRQYAGMWKDPAYFTDILEELCHLLLSRSRWDLLWDVYEVVSATGPTAASAQYAVVLAAALRSGSFSLRGTPSEQLVETLYRHALDSQGSFYYSFIAAAALGEKVRMEDPAFALSPPADVLPADGGASGPEVKGTGAKPAVEAAGDEGAILRGFFTFGLMDDGYRYAQAHASLFDAESLYFAAKSLMEKGSYLKSLRLLQMIARDRPLPYSREFLESLYPRAYAGRIESLAEEERIPPEILYGLIREESHFDPEIVSHAGAVGLTQLMPATAADIASRMRITNPVLTDPFTNLSIGTRYLGMLLERYLTVVYALAGYNAGYGRIRGWIGSWDDLPPELFIERIPYLETRGYLRKVFVSAVFYGYLYGGRGIDETAELFFPDMEL